MTLKPEHIRVNDIELANDIIWRMNETAQKQAEQIRKLTDLLKRLLKFGEGQTPAELRDSQKRYVIRMQPEDYDEARHLLEEQ